MGREGKIERAVRRADASGYVTIPRESESGEGMRCEVDLQPVTKETRNVRFPVALDLERTFMADKKQRSTQKIRWVKGPHSEVRRVEVAMAEETYSGTVFLKFFVIRPVVRATYEFEVLEDGSFGETIQEATDDTVIFEFQQGVLLDRDEARSLRDRLNEVLEEEHA